MCIILVIPTDTKLPSKDILDTCWRNNDDGGGLMYVHKNQVVVDKTIIKYDYMKMIQEVHGKYNKKSPVVLHFRVSTCGKANTENCHPFMIHTNENGEGELAYAHNGQILTVPKESPKSDSHVFADFMREGLDKNFLKNPAIMELLTVFAGSDKLVFLDNKGIITYINQQKGEMVDGIWYSNGTYKDYRRQRTVFAEMDDEEIELYYGSWIGRNHNTSMRGSNRGLTDSMVLHNGVWMSEKEKNRREKLENEAKLKSEKCHFCGSWFRGYELLDVIWDGGVSFKLCMDCIGTLKKSNDEEELRIAGTSKSIKELDNDELLSIYLNNVPVPSTDNSSPACDDDNFDGPFCAGF